MPAVESEIKNTNDLDFITEETTIMTKSDLIAALVAKENLSDKKAIDIVNLIFDGFMDTLKKGDKIEVRGLGSFSVREYGAYKGMNPKTGEKVDVGPKKVPFFKVGRGLKKLVNGSKK